MTWRVPIRCGVLAAVGLHEGLGRLIVKRETLAHLSLASLCHITHLAAVSGS